MGVGVGATCAAACPCLEESEAWANCILARVGVRNVVGLSSRAQEADFFY
jgi:hypothetical protein